jgi:hypothetical protein
MTGKAGAALDASGPTPTLRDQSLHFANRNPAKSMKTSHVKNSNRYTFRVSGFVLANPELERTSANSVTLWHPEASDASPHLLPRPRILITKTRLEIDAND